MAEQKKAGRPRKKAEPKKDPVVQEEIEIKPEERRFYTVNVKSMLNVRSAPEKGNNIIRQLENGSTVEVFEKLNGFARIGDGEWVMLDYLH